MAMEYNAKINKKNDIAGKNYHRRPKKKSINPQKTRNIEKNAYVAFNSQESSKQEKHCDKVPFTEFRQSSYGGMSILLSLDVYAMGSRLRHILRREICSSNPVPIKVFGDTW